MVGQRRLWVRVDVQASADRKGPRVTGARPLSPLLAAEPAYLAGGGSPGFDRHMGSPRGERQPLAGNPTRGKPDLGTQRRFVKACGGFQFLCRSPPAPTALRRQSPPLSSSRLAGIGICDRLTISGRERRICPRRRSSAEG